MYFDVVCVVGVVAVVFVVIQDFILAGNNQKYVNSNLHEHQKNCLVCHRPFSCLIQIFFVYGVAVI